MAKPRPAPLFKQFIVRMPPEMHAAITKPALFCDLVERMSPGPYLELFARAPRLGWDSWGYGYESKVGA